VRRRGFRSNLQGQVDRALGGSAEELTCPQNYQHSSWCIQRLFDSEEAGLSCASVPTETAGPTYFGKGGGGEVGRSFLCRHE
jgi:hypothetical protein